MAIRSDLTINWDASPRIITIDAPSTEIIIQDLHDSLRFLEAELISLHNPVLIDTAGLEELGGGTEVGLTSTLQNALIAFEARAGTETIQCSVSGGNVVAKDINGVTLKTPIHPTAFTQLVVTASSSATTQSQKQLEHSTFNTEVAVYLTGVNSVSGTDFPAGTLQTPCNNMIDALSVAQKNGLASFKFKDNITLVEDFSEGYNFTGASPYIVLTADSVANITNCSVTEMTLTGELDGLNTITRCSVIDITEVSGFFEKCAFVSTIQMNGNTTVFESYDQAYGDAYSVWDTGTYNLTLNDWHGDVGVTNMTSGTSVLEVYGGKIWIDATCTGGTICLRGDAYEVSDLSGVGCIIKDQRRVKDIADEILGREQFP
jgi:hypothetical protein